MSNRISFNPNYALDSNHDASSGAVAYFYDTGTSNAQTVYTDSGLTAGVTSLTADSAGEFADVFSADTTDLKVVVKTSGGSTLYTIDPAVVQSTGGGASTVAFSPTGSISSTDVQAAIEETYAAAAASDVVSDTSPQLGGTLDTNSKQIRESKGADVASATNTVLGSDGNYFDITGTTTIATIGTLAIGTVVKLHFDGALTLTHHATDLILPGGVNITTAAGDEAEFIEDATGDWRCLSYTRATGSGIFGGTLQTVSTSDGAVATGTTVIPSDDTIPQITEGDEYMTLAITPKSAASTLYISVVGVFGSSATRNVNMALFVDATADAIAADGAFLDNSTGTVTIPLAHKVASGSTTARTYRVRAGLNAGGTITFNGAGGGRYFGGVSSSSITIKEVI